MNELSTDAVRSWLEWAGARLLLLPPNGPKQLHSSWPGVVIDRGAARIAYRISAVEYTLLDETSELPLLITAPPIRRLVQLRSIIRPNSGQYVYKWTRLGELCTIDHRTVRRWHQRGLEEICDKLPAERVERFTAFHRTTTRLP
jgi:hypothetical protein